MRCPKLRPLTSKDQSVYHFLSSLNISPMALEVKTFDVQNLKAIDKVLGIERGQNWQFVHYQLQGHNRALRGKKVSSQCFLCK